MDLDDIGCWRCLKVGHHRQACTEVVTPEQERENRRAAKRAYEAAHPIPNKSTSHIAPWTAKEFPVSPRQKHKLT